MYMYMYTCVYNMCVCISIVSMCLISYLSHQAFLEYRRANRGGVRCATRRLDSERPPCIYLNVPTLWEP